jgi:hypothetical protein
MNYIKIENIASTTNFPEPRTDEIIKQIIDPATGDLIATIRRIGHLYAVDVEPHAFAEALATLPRTMVGVMQIDGRKIHRFHFQKF